MRCRFILGLVSLTLFALLNCSTAFGSQSCLTKQCHPQIDNIPRQHDPVASEECDSCHMQTASGHPNNVDDGFELIAEDDQICLECHDAPVDNRVVHSPVEEGECSMCHDPHGDVHGMLSEGRNVASVCLECHELESMEQTYQHGPVAAGDCVVCHNPHSSENESLLAEDVKSLCLGCHDDFEDIEHAPVLHPPVQEDDCTTCHDPHGAAVKNLLSTAQPEVCFECHDDIKDVLDNSPLVHAPVEDEDGCGGCHSTHFSDYSGLIASSQEKLCLSCHGAEGKNWIDSFSDIQTELADKKFLHGPIEEGDCSSCHNPHGAGNFRLFEESYPEGFYAPYEPGAYDFCLQCHEENLLRFPDTSIYTNFRNGKNNLHYVHVANDRKGRTCRVCHEPHAANLPRMIREVGAAFGDWKVPLGFNISETGGSCAPGCHQPFSYDREKPIEY